MKDRKYIAYPSDGYLLRWRRGQENRGRRSEEQKKRQKHGKEKDLGAEGFLRVRRREAEGIAKCKGGFISFAVLFIDVLSASLVPTGRTGVSLV